jgi:predicted homoserine dehydrogenase-like protein
VTTWTRVARLAAEERPLRVGIVGAGYVGRGLVHLLDRLPGFRPALVVNRTVSRGVDAFVHAGVDAERIEVVDSADDARRALERGQPVVTADPDVAIALDDLDVLVEATGTIDHGATVMLDALRAGRTVVSINAEVDAALGWLLHTVAAAHGGIYTICDGDQPGVQMRTLDQVRHMAFDVVASVNCKRHMDVHQSIADSAPYAARDDTSIAVTVSAGDGTKMNIEQAVVANLAGLPPDCRGMHGVPTVLERALADVLGAISQDGVVDYTLGGDFGAGVFVIGRAPEPDVVRTPLRFFKLGDGPEYLLFSPYTLVHFEMPRSIAEVVLDRAPLWSPAGPPVADVVAIAKRPLVPGEPLDGIGGDTCYGQIDALDGACGLLPIAFAEHARVLRAVDRDAPIPLDAVEIDPDAPIVRLRAQQDELLAAGVG